MVVAVDEHRYLVDCGEGTQRQILRSGIGFKRLNKILLTHGHLDHILGLGGLVSSFASWEEELDELDIWAGKPTLERVERLLYGVVLDYDNLEVVIRLHELSPGIIELHRGFSVSAVSVVHRGAGCYGFIFKEHDHRPFLADRAEALGIPHGEERRTLIEGHRITLANGRVVEPDEVLGETESGAKIAVIGDTGQTANLLEAVQDATVLVIEATFLQRDEELAKRFGHLTAARAAQLAKDANVGTLILTHISRRYHEREVRDEARAIFPNTIVARDLEQYQVKRNSGLSRLTDAVAETSD